MAKTDIASSLLLVQNLATDIKTKLDFLIGKIDVCRFQIAGEEINTILDDLLKKIPINPAFEQQTASFRYKKIFEISPALKKSLHRHFRGIHADLTQIRLDSIVFKMSSFNLPIVIANFFVVLLSADFQMNGINICLFGSLICVMIIVLLSQSLVKSSCLAVGLSWIISIIFTNFSMRLSKSFYLWVNVNYYFLCCMSYELERHTLRTFINSPTKIKVSETNSQLNLSETSDQIPETSGIAEQKIAEGNFALESERAIVRHMTHEVREMFVDDGYVLTIDQALSHLIRC